jgi:hypothetical protein
MLWEKWLHHDKPFSGIRSPDSSVGLSWPAEREVLLISPRRWREFQIFMNASVLVKQKQLVTAPQVAHTALTRRVASPSRVLVKILPHPWLPITLSSVEGRVWELITAQRTVRRTRSWVRGSYECPAEMKVPAPYLLPPSFFFFFLVSFQSSTDLELQSRSGKIRTFGSTFSLCWL